jgi:diguanylate cyclase (GGDEF)-like protein
VELPNEKIEEAINSLISLPLVILDYIGNIISYNESFERIFVSDKPIIGKHIREMGSEEIWKLFLLCKDSKREAKDRVRLEEKEYEVIVHPDKTGQFFSILLYDISRFLSIEEDLIRRNRELMIINTLSEIFISSMDTQEFFEDLLTKILMITDFDIGMIIMLRDSNFCMVSQQGFSPRFIKMFEKGEVEAIIMNLPLREYPMYILEESEINRYPLLYEEGLVFLAIVALRVSDRIEGYLLIASRKPRAFDFALASILNLIGNQVSLIIEKFRLFEETKRLSVTDPLTGLYNVRYFYSSLKTEIERSKRYDERFSIAIFDIDNFKNINDTYGHQVGDNILQEFSDILLKQSRKADIVARYGGEEFVIILPKTSKSEALLLAERISQAIHSHTFEILNSAGSNTPIKVKITISGGIAGYPEDGVSEKELLYAADMAMYRAKAEGKGRVYLYDKTKDSKGFQKT